VIVAETNKVTIYDGDDPSLPMWMVFNADFSYASRLSLGAGGSFSSVAVINGAICLGSRNGPANSGVNALFVLDFVVGRATKRTTLGLYVWSGGLQGTNSDGSYSKIGDGPIASDVNDVAMTVLPDAPIDPATGLPVPTIAVATDGGVSVIRDDGTVVDITWTNTGMCGVIAFNGINQIVVSHDGTATRNRFVHVFDIPNADLSEGNGYIKGSAVLYLNSTSNNSDLKVLSDYGTGLDGGTHGGIKGLALFDTKKVAYTTSTYNTGWMNGDIKGAFLSDTDDTDLVGSGELVTNGTFDTVTTGWTAIANTTLTIDTGRLKVTSDANALGGAYQTITTVVGQRYLLTFTGLESTSTSSNGRVYVGTSLGGTQLGIAYAVGDNEITFEFTATTTTTYLQLNQNTATAGLYMLFDDVSVVAADADRSVNGNPLKINGTVTRTPVATGADLVAYSGFSASNYLEQPYNSDLDFGTGDFCVMGWVQESATSDWIVDRMEGRDGSSNLWGFDVFQSSTLRFSTYENNGSTYVLATTVMGNNDGVWHFFAGVRRNGTLEMHFNGVLEATTTGTLRNVSYTSTGTAPPLTIGARTGGSAPWQYGSAALLRISATAPTAEQIAKIYNDEKPLFQENAQATLFGTSDSVTALAHDSDTDLLHVGTSDGRSVFQGLRRVSSTTNAVGTAISASNGLVVEE
jgi:hypothetical protein